MDRLYVDGALERAPHRPPRRESKARFSVRCTSARECEFVEAEGIAKLLFAELRVQDRARGTSYAVSASFCVPPEDRRLVGIYMHTHLDKTTERALRAQVLEHPKVRAWLKRAREVV